MLENYILNNSDGISVYFNFQLDNQEHKNTFRWGFFLSPGYSIEMLANIPPPTSAGEGRGSPALLICCGYEITQYHRAEHFWLVLRSVHNNMVDDKQPSTSIDIFREVSTRSSALLSARILRHLELER